MHSRASARNLAIVCGLVLAVLGSGLLLASPGARADHDTVGWASFGSVVGASATLSNGNPFVLADNQGHVYVFYVQTNSTLFPAVGNVRVAKLNATGDRLGGPVRWFDKQINDVSNVAQIGGYTTAGIDGDGNLYVAWTRVSAAPAYEDIYVSKSLDGGQTWLNAVRAGTPNDGTRDQIPTMAIAPSGAVYVAWTSYRNSSWFYNISFAMSTNGGNSFINQRLISLQGPGGQAIIDTLAIDSRGRAYAAWIAVDPDFNATQEYHINVTWSDDGISWATPSPITASKGFALYPTLAIDKHDHVHLAWLDGRTAYSVGPTMWYTRSEDRGATWTPQRPVGAGLSTPGALPILTVHEQTVLVAWGGSRTIGATSRVGLGYAISADGGTSWYPEGWTPTAFGAAYGNATRIHVSPDRDGTFWSVAELYDSSGFAGDVVSLLWWNGPPSPPSIQSVSVSGTGATVRWTAPPEGDVAGYSVWRSSDGTNWAYVASVGAATTSYTDSNLANGTYWYQVRAIDTMGTDSHASASTVAQVGPSLQDQIDALRQAFNDLQSSQNTELNALKNQINALQQAVATQSTALLNTGLEVVIVVLLGLLLYMQVRKPKNPRPVVMAPQSAVSPPGDPTSRLDEEL